MGRERKLKQHLPAGNSGKERHRRDARPVSKKVPTTVTTSNQPSQPLKALKDAQKYKYTSRFEWVENEDKKDKRINLITSTSIKPPPGYIFIPVGNPLLTKACKEMSRAQDAPVYIVTLSKTERPTNPDKTRNTPTSEDEDESMLEQLKDYKNQMTRLGYHFREQVVDEIADDGDISAKFPWVTIQQNDAGVIIPEPIPKDQTEIYRQADLVISDLFPRIPNTDRAVLIAHAFNKSAPTFRGEKKVGLAADIVLSRRCALAVLAHIRHTHTRYDELLKECNYIQARKAVQEPCLNILVKWRGDEETGRDTAPEVLRELVVIDDDSASEPEFGEAQNSTNDSDTSQDLTPSPRFSPSANTTTPQGLPSPPDRVRSAIPAPARQQSHPVQHATASGHIRKPSRNFRRYEQLERKYGAEELARCRTHQERLLGAVVQSEFVPNRTGGRCTPPPLLPPPLPRRTATEVVLIQDSSYVANGSVFRGYQHTSPHGQASAVHVASEHSRCFGADVEMQSVVVPPHPYYGQVSRQDHFTTAQEASYRTQQPLVIRERVKPQDDHSPNGAPAPATGPQALPSPLHLEDMLVPSVEPASPGAYAARPAQRPFDRPQYEARRDMSPRYQTSVPGQSHGLEFRSDDRHVEYRHPQSSIPARELSNGLRHNDLPSVSLPHPRDGARYAARPVPALHAVGSRQSTLDTMGFIQINRNDEEGPLGVSRGQRHSQPIYQPVPTGHNLSNSHISGIQSMLVHRAPARQPLQQLGGVVPESHKAAQWYSPRVPDDRSSHFTNHDFHPHQTHLSGRDAGMNQSSLPAHLQRSRELIIID